MTTRPFLEDAYELACLDSKLKSKIDGSVRIIAQSEEEKLREFIKLINNYELRNAKI